MNCGWGQWNQPSAVAVLVHQQGSHQQPCVVKCGPLRFSFCISGLTNNWFGIDCVLKRFVPYFLKLTHRLKSVTCNNVNVNKLCCKSVFNCFKVLKVNGFWNVWRSDKKCVPCFTWATFLNYLNLKVMERAITFKLKWFENALNKWVEA